MPPSKSSVLGFLPREAVETVYAAQLAQLAQRDPFQVDRWGRGISTAAGRLEQTASEQRQLADFQTAAGVQASKILVYAPVSGFVSGAFVQSIPVHPAGLISTAVLAATTVATCIGTMASLAPSPGYRARLKRLAALVDQLHDQIDQSIGIGRRDSDTFANRTYVAKWELGEEAARYMREGAEPSVALPSGEMVVDPTMEALGHRPLYGGPTQDAWDDVLAARAIEDLSGFKPGPVTQRLAAYAQRLLGVDANPGTMSLV